MLYEEVVGGEGMFEGARPCVAFMLAVGTAVASQAQTQVPAWAVGKWVGKLEGFSGKSKDGPDRVLVIAANGKCRWGVSPAAPGDTLSCAISDNSVNLVTSANSEVKLAFGNGALNGSFSQQKSIAYSITMNKQ